MKPFAGSVKEIRSKLGWTQEELAHQIGVSLSTVQRWEKSGTQPSRLARRELDRLTERSGIAASQGKGQVTV